MNLAFLQDGQISLFLQVQIYRTSPSTRVPLYSAMLRTICTFRIGTGHKQKKKRRRKNRLESGCPG